MLIKGLLKRLRRLGGVGVILFAGFYGTAASADPVTFVFNCTISGTGAGNNVCDQGPNVAQLTIAETNVEGVLALSILRLFPAPPDGPDDLTLNALHLNYIGDLGDGLGNSALPWHNGPGPNDYNYLEFSFEADFDPLRTIQVENNETNALNYKGFDLQLCDTGVGRCDTPVTFIDTIFGFVRSGNDFILTPELFDGLTEDTLFPDRARLFDDCMLLPAHLRAAVHITPATSGSVANNEVCGGGGNYGPYYGSVAADERRVPEPGTLALLGVGLFGLGLFGRR